MYLRILTGKKIPLNKTPALTEDMNMDIWLINTSNQLSVGDSYSETKKKVVAGKTPFFVIGPFCTSHSICLKIGF